MQDGGRGIPKIRTDMFALSFTCCQHLALIGLPNTSASCVPVLSTCLLAHHVLETWTSLSLDVPGPDFLGPGFEPHQASDCRPQTSPGLTASLVRLVTGDPCLTLFDITIQSSVWTVRQEQTKQSSSRLPTYGISTHARTLDCARSKLPTPQPRTESSHMSTKCERFPRSHPTSLSHSGR